MDCPRAEFLQPSDGAREWRRPVINIVKINTDAALFPEKGGFGFAFVARNHLGHFMEAVSRFRLGVLSPEVAEAFSVKEALSWVKGQSWERVVLETENLLVVQAIRIPILLDSYFGSVIEDCKTLCKEMGHVHISFVFRSANRIAHLFARESCYQADQVWLPHMVPSHIFAVLSSE